MMKIIALIAIVGWSQLVLASPSWFTETKSDTASQYYGYGAGDTQEDAVKAALNDIASKIAVTIESSYASMQTVSGDSFVNERKNEILANVKKMKFNNHEVMKSVNDSDEIYVLVRVDREQLLEEKKSELDILSSKLSEEQASIQNTSDIEKYKTIMMLEDDLKTLNETFFMSKSIVPSFEGDEYAELYKNFKKMMVNSKSGIVLFIDGDTAVSKNYAKVFSNYLSKQGIKVSQTKANAILMVTTNIKEKKVESTSEAIKNSKFASVELSTVLKKADGTQIASNSTRFVNNSSASYDDATKKTQKLEKFLSERPEKVLNFIFAINQKEE